MAFPQEKRYLCRKAVISTGNVVVHITYLKFRLENPPVSGLL
jgi:hypothetical protein